MRASKLKTTRKAHSSIHTPHTPNTDNQHCPSVLPYSSCSHELGDKLLIIGISVRSFFSSDWVKALFAHSTYYCCLCENAIRVRTAAVSYLYDTKRFWYAVRIQKKNRKKDRARNKIKAMRTTNIITFALEFNQLCHLDIAYRQQHQQSQEQQQQAAVYHNITNTTLRIPLFLHQNKIFLTGARIILNYQSS